MEFKNEDFAALDTGLIASDVGFDALESLMDYYPRMLSFCYKIISELTGDSIEDIKKELEEQNELTGVLETSIQQLSASKELLGDLLEYLEVADSEE